MLCFLNNVSGAPKVILNQILVTWNMQKIVMLGICLKFDLDLTYQGHSKSKVMMPNESSYMVLYKSTYSNFMPQINGFHIYDLGRLVFRGPQLHRLTKNVP